MWQIFCGSRNVDFLYPLEISDVSSLPTSSLFEKKVIHENKETKQDVVPKVSEVSQTWRARKLTDHQDMTINVDNIETFLYISYQRLKVGGCQDFELCYCYFLCKRNKISGVCNLL